MNCVTKACSFFLSLSHVGRWHLHLIGEELLFRTFTSRVWVSPITRGSQVVEKGNVFTIIGLKQLSHFLHLSAIFIPKKKETAQVSRSSRTICGEVRQVLCRWQIPVSQITQTTTLPWRGRIVREYSRSGKDEKKNYLWSWLSSFPFISLSWLFWLSLSQLLKTVWSFNHHRSTPTISYHRILDTWQMIHVG